MDKRLAERLPKVNLIEFGESTSSGRTVDIGLLESIYKQASAGDKRHVSVPDAKEIEHSARERGTDWFVIENMMGEIVGVFAVQLKKHRERISLKNISKRIATPNWKGWIGRMFVLKKFRGKGYFPSAYIKLEEKARSGGVAQLFSSVVSKNKKMIRMLGKIGFRKSFWGTARQVPLNIQRFGIKRKGRKRWRVVFSKRIR